MYKFVRSMLCGLLVGSLTVGVLAGVWGDDKQDKQDKQTGPPNPLTKLAPYVGPKKPVVVMGIDVKVTKASIQIPLPSGATQEKPIDLPSEFGAGLTEVLITELFQTGRFVVLEASAAELLPGAAPGGNLPPPAGNPPPVDPQAAAAPPAAQLLPPPSRTQVRGAITTLSFRSSAQALGGGGAAGLPASPFEGGRAKTEAIVRLDIRLTESVTGEVVAAYQAEGKVTSSKSFLNLTIKDVTSLGTTKVDENPLGQAVRLAIRNAVVKICQQTDSLPWEARVARVSGEGENLSLFLTEGARTGLEPDDILEVVRLGEEVRDPVTGKLLGRDEQRVGQCRIKSVPQLQSFSVAVPTEGTEFKIGDVVRFVRRPAKDAPPVKKKK
ncbi:CsgG/HfaB family protein [Armatimonas sp.]|uniref:CsgG/HfaB family protein n=1 Tax=Armatimonas sp. TaxID=1872638 RepID=UPI00374C9361